LLSLKPLLCKILKDYAMYHITTTKRMTIATTTMTL
jgi:hypothetical protein